MRFGDISLWMDGGKLEMKGIITHWPHGTVPVLRIADDITIHFNNTEALRQFCESHIIPIEESTRNKSLV